MAREFTYGRPPEQYDQQYLARLVGELENWSRALAGQTLGYTATNLTETRAIDGAAATLGDTRQVLATLISDLKNLGIIR